MTAQKKKKQTEKGSEKKKGKPQMEKRSQKIHDYERKIIKTGQQAPSRQD